MGCFVRVWDRPNSYDEKFPSPCGVWVVSMWPTKLLGRCDLVSVPLRGVGCFEADRMEIQGEKLMFPSPCGVWVVSAKLHILFGATGKRIVNSAVLLYHIGRWFINSKLRNYKVPCEAHKTET